MGQLYAKKPPLGAKINWSNPLTGGLVGCWLMNEGGGNIIYDSAFYGNGLFKTTTLKWIGDGIKFNGTSDYIEVPHNAAFPWGNSVSDVPFSIFAKVNMANATGFRIMAKDNGTNLCWMLSGGSSGALNGGFAAYDNDASNNSSVTATGAGITGVDQTFGASYKGGGSNGMVLYTNGFRPAYSNGSSGTFVAEHNIAAQLRIGYLQALSQFANGTMSFIYLWWNRLLQPSDFITLHADPYCFFERQPLWSMFNPGGGAAAQPYQPWMQIQPILAQ